MAKSFWVEVKKVAGVSICPNLHPCTWATDVLHETIISPATAAVLVSGAWALWTGRNGKGHGYKVWEPGVAAWYISSMLEELASLKVRLKLKQPRNVVPWKRPGEGWMKVNTNAAFDQDMCIGSAGVVIWDHSGLVQAAAARWFDNVPADS